METLTWRRLSAREPADIDAVQRVLEAAPAFSLQVEGRLPPPDAAREEFHEAPPGKTADDKAVLGFSVGGTLVGSATLIRGYPEADIAYLGLLVFAESAQRRRLGAQAMRVVDGVAAEWGCAWLRLAVIASNTIGHAYWLRDGFVELYRRTLPQFTAEAIVMQRPVRKDNADN